MNKHFLLGLCLLTNGSYAHPPDGAQEPIGNRFGLSLIEVIDSVYKEGIYHYFSSSADSGNPSSATNVMFRDASGKRVLSYSFDGGRCELAMLMLPLTELDSVVQVYDHQFPSLGKQIWRSAHGRIKVSVAIGQESIRRDHKPHVTVIFDPKN